MTDVDASTSEFDDSDDVRAGYDWARIDLARLLGPEATRRIIGIVIALCVVFWPQRSVDILGRLVGIGLLGYAFLTMWALRGIRPVPRFAVASSIVALFLGGFLAAFPSQTEVALGRILGSALVVAGVANFVASFRRHQHTDVRWRLTSACSVAAIGVLVALFPSELLSILAASLAVAWIVIEAVAISVLIDPDRNAHAARTTTSWLVAEWFADRPQTVDDRERLYVELLYEGDRTQTKVTRFVILMVFATVIASMGVVADSTAVVVGAMLIAPLLTPLMGMALSLVMGWPNRLARSSLVALAGILVAIVLGFLIGLADFTIIDTATNSQIVSRSSPTIVDLLIAVAAGGAGAYAWSRPDVSNSLPGVAVAIALVPPLTVIGISYSQGDWDSGNGALLLFATNAIAILIVGAGVFLLSGIAPLSRVAANQYRVRTALAAVGGAAAVITAAVVLNGTSVATDVFDQNTAGRVVNAWIAPFPDYSIVSVDVAGDTVSVVLAGPTGDDRPSADVLATDLSAGLGDPITVDLSVRLEIQETSGT